MFRPRTRSPRGDATEVPAATLIPGDVLAVEVGDIVPADARVVSARGLRADESTLTGEAARARLSAAPENASRGLPEPGGPGG